MSAYGRGELVRFAEDLTQDPDDAIELQRVGGDEAVTDWLLGILIESLAMAGHATGAAVGKFEADALYAARALEGRPGMPAVQMGLEL